MQIEPFIASLCDRVVQYIQAADAPGKVVTDVPHETRKRSADLRLPVEGRGTEAVLDDIDDYLRACVKTNRAEFMNPLWGGLNLAGFAGEIIASLTNTSMYTYELAPLATLIEQAILRRMAEIVGFPDGAGTLTTGGSSGNMHGMLCARQAMNPAATTHGVDGRALVVLVSSESHYSVLMAGGVIGIGHRNVVRVACDADGRMDPDALSDAIHRAREQGRSPFCVVSTAGTTVRGAFDPLREIGAIAARENLWHHVDAAWGGSAMFSKTHRTLMDGVETADSVCWDAHKMMGLPLICSAFMTRDADVLARVCAHGDAAHYLFHEDTRDIDPGRYSLQCGRRNDALKLWLAWRECGDDGWAEMVDRYVALANYLEQGVAAHADLELLSARSWTNVCFRYSPEDADVDLNVLNSAVRQRIMRNGEFMVSRSNIGDDVILRPVISNPKVSKATIDGLIAEVVRVGADIVADLPSAGRYAIARRSA